MRFGDLRHASLPDFLEGGRDQDAFWFLMHIPKTAGSSFATELRARRRPFRNICIDRSRTGAGHQENLRQSLDEFLARPDVGQFRSGRGHLNFALMKKLRERLPDAKVVTFLRTPEHRVVSGYYYQKSPMHRRHAKFAQNFPTLESFVESPIAHNMMSRYIGGRSADREALRRRIEEDFAFVGLVEMYPMGFNIAFELMGISGALPSEHRRKNSAAADRADEVTPQVLRRIREVNALDVEIYEHVQGILLPHKADWEAHRLRNAGASSEREASQLMPLGGAG